jgi:hypothetical protein
MSPGILELSLEKLISDNEEQTKIPKFLHSINFKLDDGLREFSSKDPLNQDWSMKNYLKVLKFVNSSLPITVLISNISS